MVETGKMKNGVCSNWEVCAGKMKNSAWSKGKMWKKRPKWEKWKVVHGGWWKEIKCQRVLGLVHLWHTETAVAKPGISSNQRVQFYFFEQYWKLHAYRKLFWVLSRFWKTTVLYKKSCYEREHAWCNWLKWKCPNWKLCWKRPKKSKIWRKFGEFEK